MSSIKKPTSSFVQLAMLLVGSTLFFAEGAHAMRKQPKPDDNQSVVDDLERKKIKNQYTQDVLEETFQESQDHQKKQASRLQRNQETLGDFSQKNSEIPTQNFGTSSYFGNLQRDKPNPQPHFGQNPDFPIPNLRTNFAPQETKESEGEQLFKKFAMQLQEAVEKILSLKKEKKSMNENIRFLTGENQSMNENIRFLTGENQSMKHCINFLESSLAQKDNEIEHLKSMQPPSEEVLKTKALSQKLDQILRSEESDENNFINENSHEEAGEQKKK